jgi:tRNA threonylcarbamoyladenosine biosynthesis protein TsaB
MEVYAEIFDSNGISVREVAADIINENSYLEYLSKKNIYFFGNGSDKCKPMLTSPNAKFLDSIVPLAENMIAIAEEAYEKKKFEDVAYFEPFYLKEFYTTAKI